MDRSEWELAFALLGGRGLRPQHSDVSLDDAGVPPLGPGAGDWRVYLTTPEDEREFVVARSRERQDDARELAAVVAAALAGRTAD